MPYSYSYKPGLAPLILPLLLSTLLYIISLNTTSLAVILRSYRDWDLWYSRLQELAETLDVWEYIDPESAIVPS